MGVKALDIKQFIEKAKEVHGDKYNYSKSIYTKSCNKLTIICPIHGEFEQIATNHLQNNGCIKCANIYKNIKNKKSQEQFIKEARDFHRDKYDYSLVEYKNSYTKIKII